MIETPVGPLHVVVDRDAVVAVSFGAPAHVEVRSPVLDEAESQLRAYFTGALVRFDLPLAPKGTEFQQRVWKALLDVPRGTTTSYGALAEKLGSVARAVGLANGANPIAVIVPCHRVVGANGDLTGYAGGLERKRWLLVHERAILA